MLPTIRGSLLAAGAALTLLPAFAPVRAGELGAEESCSRADAHASQALDGPATRDETVEAALAIETARPLPAIAPGPPAVPGIGRDESVEATAPQPRPVWLRPDETAPQGLLGEPVDVPRDADATSAPLAFRDSAAPRERARDLRRLRELKLLRLFDTRELMVWLGLDRKGRPGLHFRQRNPGESMPVPAQAAFLAEPPPLRSVPLTSP